MRRGVFGGREEGRLKSVSSMRERLCGTDGGEIDRGDFELGSVGVGRLDVGRVVALEFSVVSRIQSSVKGLCGLEDSLVLSKLESEKWLLSSLCFLFSGDFDVESMVVDRFSDVGGCMFLRLAPFSPLTGCSFLD